MSSSTPNILHMQGHFQAYHPTESNPPRDKSWKPQELSFLGERDNRGGTAATNAQGVIRFGE